jgi:hypothetical protein
VSRNGLAAQPEACAFSFAILFSKLAGLAPQLLVHMLDELEVPTRLEYQTPS